MSAQPAGFFIAPFGIDGEPEGFDYWELSKLSDEWLVICGEQLLRHGDSFDVSWEGRLSHVRMKFTKISEAALITFSILNSPAASVVLMSGKENSAETELLDMFVRSLQKTHLFNGLLPTNPPLVRYY